MPTIADLSVTVDDGKTSVVPGVNYDVLLGSQPNFPFNNDYTVTVTNNGPDTVTQFNLNIVPGAGLTWLATTNPSVNGSVGTLTSPNFGDFNTWLWSGLSLASGQSAFATFVYNMDQNATGPLTLTFTVSPPAGTTDPTPTNDSFTDSDPPQADLAVTMTDGKTTVVPGTSNTYTITVTNNGPSTVTSLTLTDSLPAALLNPNFAPSVGAYDTNTGIWSGLSLASGGTVTLTLTGTIDPNATGPITNTVTVTAPSGTTDTNAANDTASDTDTIPTADLAVTVTDGKTTVVPGTSNTYTITVTNNGPDTVTSLTLSDTIPASLLNPNFAPSVGAYNVGTGAWSGLNLATGQSVTMTLTGTVDPSATGSLANIVTVSPPAGTTDSNSANDSFTDNDTLTPQADLAVTMTDGVTTVAPGDSIAYTMRVTNNGPSMVDALVTDLFPADFTNILWFVVLNSGAISASPSGGNGDIHDTVKLLPGGSATFRASGQISASATGPLANTVTVTAPAGTTDSNPANDTATDTNALQLPADLAVTITDAATTLAPGSVDTYTITVANNGPNTVSSFTLIDAIPAALLNATFGSPSAGSYDPGSGLWSGLNLANGQSVSITRSAVIGIATGTLSNTVTVSLPAGLADTNAGNNAATDTDMLVLFSSPYPPPPSATSANMILRRTDGLYAIYNLGNNATLATHPLAQVGSEWQFAGVGRFQAGDTADMLLRNANTGGFQVYDINNNNITNTAFLGNVGLDWQVMGFGNFSSRGESDMILRNSNTGGLQVYDISNNQITGTAFMGTVGLNWQFSGVGNFSGAGESDMLLRNANTGGLQVYDIANNAITGSAFLGTVGLDWQFSGVGNFSGVAGETDLLLRNVNTGGLQVYDITNNQLTGSAFLGTVGLDWQFAGVAAIRGPGTSDLVLRNVTTGAFEAYSIANNQITGAASLGPVGLEWQVGGFAADPAPASTGSADSTSQLVQAMAAFGGGGAADGSNAPPLNADASQQTFLTQPQA
jgi:uncharacterized repeat protein (TIGR01451 family)